MRSNLVNQCLWIFLIGVAGAIALWFSLQTTLGIFKYYHLDAKAPAHLSSLSVQEVKGTRYLVEAKYIYEVKGRSYLGKTLFCEPVYLNRLSAEEDFEKWKQFSWEAFYNSKNVKESSLQRVFPLKKSIYTLLSIGVFIYFCLFYMFKKQVKA